MASTPATTWGTDGMKNACLGDNSWPQVLVSVAANLKQPSAERLMAPVDGKGILQLVGDISDSYGADAKLLQQQRSTEVCNHDVAAFIQATVQGQTDPPVCLDYAQQAVCANKPTSQKSSPTTAPLPLQTPTQPMDQPAAKVRRLNTDQSPKASTELIGHAVLAPARNTPAAIHPWADAEPMHLWELQGPPELQTDAPGYAQGLMDDICMGMGLYDAEPLLAYTTGSPPGPQANLQRTQSGCAPSNTQHAKQEKEQLQQLPHLEPMHELLSGVPSLPDLVGLESCPLAPAPESAVHSSEAVNTAADNTVPASQAPENMPEHGMVRRHGHHPAAVPSIAESRPASQAAVVQSLQETLGPSALNLSAYDNQHQRQQAQHPAHGTARAMPDAAGTMWPLTGRGSMTADVSALQAGRRLSTASGSRQTEDGRQSAAAPGPGQLLCTQSMHVGVPLVHEHPFEVHPLPPWAGACPAGYRLPPMPQRHRLYRNRASASQLRWASTDPMEFSQAAVELYHSFANDPSALIIPRSMLMALSADMRKMHQKCIKDKTKAYAAAARAHGQPAPPVPPAPHPDTDPALLLLEVDQEWHAGGHSYSMGRTHSQQETLMLRSSMSMQQTHTSMQSLERQSTLLPMQSGPSPHAGMGMGNDIFFARETNSGSQGPMGMSGMLVKASSLPMSQAISGAYPGQRWQQQQMMFANQQQQVRLQRTLPQAQGSADMYGGQMGMQPARQSVNRGPCMGQSDGRMAREEEDVTGPMQGLHGRNASTLCPSHATMQAQQQRAAMGGVAGNGGGDWVACVADGSPMHGDNRARPGAPHTQAGAVTCATRQGAGAGPCATLQPCTSAPVGWAPATSLTRQLSGSLSTRQGDAPGMPMGSFPPSQAMGAPPHDMGAPPWAGPMPPYGPASYYGMPQPSGVMPQGMPRYMRGRAGVPVPACYMQPGGMGWVGGIADEPYGVCMAGQGMEPPSAAGSRNGTPHKQQQLQPQRAMSHPHASSSGGGPPGHSYPSMTQQQLQAYPIAPSSMPGPYFPHHPYMLMHGSETGAGEGCSPGRASCSPGDADRAAARAASQQPPALQMQMHARGQLLGPGGTCSSAVSPSSARKSAAGCIGHAGSMGAGPGMMQAVGQGSAPAMRRLFGGQSMGAVNGNAPGDVSGQAAGQARHTQHNDQAFFQPQSQMVPQVHAQQQQQPTVHVQGQGQATGVREHEYALEWQKAAQQIIDAEGMEPFDTLSLFGLDS